MYIGYNGAMASHSDTSMNPDLCPVRHPLPPAYTASNQDRPKLEFRKYKARDLLNCTVGSFFGVPEEEQSVIQLKAKAKFIKGFSRCMKLTPIQLPAEDLSRILAGLMRQVDDYFFFGSLTRASVPVIEELRICDCKDIQGSLGLCSYKDGADGVPRSAVSIAQDDMQEKSRSLPELVGSLLHEMAHAYLHAFVCDLPRCGRNHLNTKGVAGSLHGPTFRALVYAVMVCMSDWAHALRNHFNNSTLGSYVEPYPFSREKQILDSAKNIGHLDKSLPLVRQPSHLHLIQIREDKIIIDAGRLRTHVKNYATKPKTHTVASSQNPDSRKKSESVEKGGDESKGGDRDNQHLEPSKNKGTTIHTDEMKDSGVKFISSYCPLERR